MPCDRHSADRTNPIACEPLVNALSVEHMHARQSPQLVTVLKVLKANAAAAVRATFVRLVPPSKLAAARSRVSVGVRRQLLDAALTCTPLLVWVPVVMIHEAELRRRLVSLRRKAEAEKT
jgi:hypothetical protein